MRQHRMAGMMSVEKFRYRGGIAIHIPLDAFRAEIELRP
jgi:hypothetical protein